jgi:RNA polymerase-binding transcription factor DksA
MDDDESVFAIAQQREANMIDRGVRAASMAVRIVPGSLVVESRFCEDCADEIPAPRLQAAPWTRRCIHCQAKVERK